MRKILIGAASIFIAAAPSVAAASSGSHSPKGVVHVVSDGVRSCSTTSLSTWYRYSNGYTWNITQRFSMGSAEFILSHDPQGRSLPAPILVHYTPLVCVVDVLR